MTSDLPSRPISASRLFDMPLSSSVVPKPGAQTPERFPIHTLPHPRTNPSSGLLFLAQLLDTHLLPNPNLLTACPGHAREGRQSGLLTVPLTPLGLPGASQGFSPGHGPKMSWTSESRLGKEAMHQSCFRASLIREVTHKYVESGAGGDPCQGVSDVPPAKRKTRKEQV